MSHSRLSKLTLSPAARAALAPVPRASSGPPVIHLSFFDLSRLCRDVDRGRLTGSERRFVLEMCMLGNNTPTSRQRVWLDAIFARLAKLEQRAA